MKEWATRELGFGEILDVSFQTVKGNFSGMLLISLLFWAPALALYWIGLLIGSNGIISLSVIIYLIAGTLSVAAVMLIVRDVRREKDWHLWEIGRQARSRFWPLLGASLMFGLLILVFTFAFFLLFGIFGLGFGTLAMFTSGGSLSSIGTLGIIIGFVVFFCLYIFFVVRFGFYFPAVVFGASAPALSRSWRLTKNNVWRLIGLYLVITIIMLVIVLAPSGILRIISSPPILTTIILTLLRVITYIFYAATMAVVYFDLLVRNEAGDLLALTAQYDKFSPGQDGSDGPPEPALAAQYDNPSPDHLTSPDTNVTQAELHTDVSPEKEE